MFKTTAVLILAIALVPGLALAENGGADPVPAPLQIIIVQPAEGDYVCYTVDVIADVFGGDGSEVMEVVFQIDGDAVFTDTQAPYSYELGIDYLNGMDHVAHATAFSLSGDVAESQDVTFISGTWDPADGWAVNGKQLTVTEAGLSGAHSVRILDKYGNIVWSKGSVTFKGGQGTCTPGDAAIRALNAGGSVEVCK